MKRVRVRVPGVEVVAGGFVAVALAVLSLAACSKEKEPIGPAPTPSAPVASASAPASAAAAASVALPDPNTPPAEPLPIDIPGLTPREQSDLASVLAHFDAPCPSVAVSVAQCIVEKRACDDCDRAARYVAMGVHGGWPGQYLELAYRARFDPAAKKDVAVDGSPTKGPATAPVTIVEFGSYLCPHCAAEAPKLEALLKAHPKDVRLVFKPAWQPENPASDRSTRAAFAAGAQGKFWEMHAMLFANQPKFDASDIDGYAKTLGLDLTRFHTDMMTPATSDRLTRDRNMAKAVHLDSLPSIYVEGRTFYPFEDLDQRVAFEIAATKPPGKAGASSAAPASSHAAK